MHAGWADKLARTLGVNLASVAPSVWHDGGSASTHTRGPGDPGKTSWIGVLYIYSWQDDGTNPTNGEDWFGLLRAAGGPKLAYAAVVDATRN
jgi:hypothetical protein